MATSTELLLNLLAPGRLTAVVDVGANPIDGDPPYAPMQQQRLCPVVGFEPQPEPLAWACSACPRGGRRSPSDRTSRFTGT